MLKRCISQKTLSIILSLSLILTSVYVPVSAEGNTGDPVVETTEISTAQDTTELSSDADYDESISDPVTESADNTADESTGSSVEGSWSPMETLPQSSEGTETIPVTEETENPSGGETTTTAETYVLPTEESSPIYDETETVPVTEETETVPDTSETETVPPTEETEAPTEEETEPSTEETVPVEEPQEKVYEEIGGTISGDTVVFEGNIVISAYTTITAKKVIVHGDVIVENSLTVNSGAALEIDGDLRIQKRDENGGFTATDGHLSVEGNVLVQGSLYSQSKDSFNLKTGNIAVIEIKGNLSQIGDTWFRFYGTNSGTILFSGEGNQTVSFDRTDRYSCLGRISLAEGKESLKFATPFYGTYLTGDATFEGTDGDVSFQNLITNGYQVTIDGNLVSISDSLSGRFHVTGDVIAERYLAINVNAELEVDGDLRIQKRDGSGGFTATDGYFVVSGKVLIHGNLYSQSTYVLNMDTSENAVIEIKGNLSQIGSTYFRYQGANSGTIHFSGNGNQTVSFDRTDKKSCLGKISFAEGKDRLRFATPFHGAYLTGDVTLEGTKGDVSFQNLITNGYHVTIDGNLASIGDSLSGRFRVTGDVIVERYLAVNANAELEIDGDLRIQKRDGNGGFTATDGYLVIYGKVLIHGSLYSQSTYVLNMSTDENAVIEIRGNLFQIGRTYFRSQGANSGTIRFSGDGNQTVSFDRIDKESCIGKISLVEGKDRLKFATPFYGAYLSGDVTFEGTGGDVSFQNLITNGYQVTIDGNLVSINDSLSGKFHVTGDVIAERYLSVNANAELEIDGDLRIQKRDGNGGFTATDGYFVIYGKVLIHGSLFSQSTYPLNMDTGENAVIEIRSNLSQIGSTRFRYNGAHKGTILFSGDGKQTVSFDGTDNLSTLGKIVIANEQDKIIIATPVYGMYLTHNVNLAAPDGGYVKLLNTQDNGKSVHIEGGFISYGNTITGHWEVDGDMLLASSGSTYLNGNGYLEVAGDLRLQQLGTGGGYQSTSASIYASGNARLIAGGGLVAQGGNYCLNLSDQAVLEIKGGYHQIGNGTPIWNRSASPIVFSGSGTQTLSASGVGSVISLGKIVQSSNQSRIYATGNLFSINAAGDLNYASGCQLNTLSLNGHTAKFHGNATVGSLNLGGGRAECTGNLTITGNASVGNGLLTTGGDFIIASGSFSLGANGAVGVGGTLRYQSSSYTTINKGLVKVSGDIIHTGLGTLKFTGDAIPLIDGDYRHTLSYPVNSSGKSTRLFFDTLYANTGIGNIILPSAAYPPYDPETMDEQPQPLYPWNYFVPGDFGFSLGTAVTRHFGISGVYAPTGNFSQSYTDMTVRTVIGEVSFSRTYNSLDESMDSRIGVGFSFSHFMKLSKKDNIISITLPNGQVWNFEESSSSSGTVYTAMDSRGKLSFANGAYVLKTLDNMTYIFRDGGIESITDQAGNVLSFTVSGGLIRSMSDASCCEVRFTYDGEGRLTGLSNTLTGESVTYSYSSGKLTEVKNAAGRTTRYAYGGEGGKLSSVTNHLGIVTDNITYVNSGNDKGKVLTHKDAIGNVITYDYGDSSGETIIRDSADANGTRRVEVQGYDTTKSITGAERYTEKLVSGTWQESEHEREFVTYLLVNGENKYNEIQTKTDIYGNTTSYTRDSLGNITQVSYPDGSTETSAYQTIGGNNCLTQKKDRTGRITLYVYDEAGKLVLKEIESLNGSTGYSDSANQDSFAVTSYEYGNGSIKGLVIKKTGALGEVSQYSYDARGRLVSSDEHGVHTAYTYDNRDHVITETVSGADIETVTTTYSYNTAGEEIRKIIASASGQQSVVRTVRDGLGRPIQEIGPAQYSASQDNVSNDSYANSGAGTRHVYNNAGYVISSTDPLGNVTGYSYDYYGNVLCETKANGSKTYTEYDSLNRVTAVSFYDHTTGATNLEKTVSYRKRGMYLGTITTLYFGNGVASTTEEWSDFDGNTVRIQAADGGILTKAYSGGLLTRETSALGHSTSYAYSYGRLNTVTADFEDSSRYITKYSHDKAGNVVRIETSDNKVGSGTTYTKTEYEYDAWSRLVTAKLFDGNEVTYQQYRYDSLGRTKAQYTGLSAPLSFNGDTATGADTGYSVTRFTYDYLGKVARTTDALGNAEIAQYDNAGNLVRLTDANGTVSVMSYDLLGRKITEQISGNGSTISRRYTFDSIGCMTSVTENGETTSYTYSGKGLVTSETAGSIRKEYSYDLQGKMLQSTIKDEGSLLQQTTRSYDQMGRLASVTDSEGHGASYTYDKDSRLIKTLYSNGASETTSYNAAGHVKTLVNKDAAGNVISEYAYTYYVSGSPATKTDASGTTTYTYDGQNRLKTATYSDGTKDVYTFDDNGNRLTKTFTDAEGVVTVTSYEYDKANRLTKSTEGEAETVYTYDKAGNLLTKTTGEKTVSHSYDLLGRLITYTDGENTASYDYYTSNMRRSKTVNGEKTTHIWIGNDIAVDMGANAASYLKGVRLVWSDYGYYLYNSHGDVVQLLNENGSVIRSYDYDAFGIEKGEEPTAPDLNPYRYCGEYTDRESGYNYLRARYYDPTIGRFITADNHWNVGNMIYGDDPVKFGGVYIPFVAAMIQSGNLYVYCGNNPVARVDSTGGFWDTIFDVVSLVVSVVEVVVNPTDVGAWVGLAGDVVDLVPFVTGVGETVKAVRTAGKAVEAADTFHDAARVANRTGEIINTVDNVTDAASAAKKGWKVGDDITNLTKAGNSPAWSTVRQRYWKNVAFNSPDLYPGQLNRLKKGLAPLDATGTPFELHHPFGRGGDNFFNFKPVTQAEHRFIHYGK